MNNLCAEIGWKSINHEGEQLCGDHVDIIEQDENSTVIVLADGLGSGVKASILSTLTSKIISTMMAEGHTPHKQRNRRDNSIRQSACYNDTRLRTV